MYNQFQKDLESAIVKVVDMTSGPHSVSLGRALTLNGFSLENLDANETWEFALIERLDFHHARKLQWWLEDYRNTGISIL